MPVYNPLTQPTVVLDADTVRLSDGSRLRLHGGDAAEVEHLDKGKVGQPGGRALSDALNIAMGVEGAAPVKQGDGTPDRYGRSLGDVIAPDGASFSAELQSQGALDPGHWKTIDTPSALGPRLSDTAREALGVPASDTAFDNNENMQALIQSSANARLGALQHLVRNGSSSDIAPMKGPRDWRGADGAPELGQAFGKALDRGVDTTQGSLYGFLHAIGQVTGSDALSELGEDGVLANLTEAMRSPAAVASYEDWDSTYSVGLFAIEALGELAPQLLTTIGTGLLTGGSSALVAGVGKAALRSFVGSGSLHAATPVVARAGLAAFVPGAKAGAFASAYVQNSGETQNELTAEGINEPGTALLVGGAKAALDYASLSAVLTRGLGGLRAGAKVADNVPELLGNSIKAVAEASGTEFITEGTQTLLDELTIKNFKPEHEISRKNIIDGAIKGAIGGGAPVAVTNPVIGAMQYGMRNRSGTGTGSGIDTTDPLQEQADRNPLEGIDTTDPLQEQADRNPLEGIDTVELPSNDSPVTGTEEESEASVKAQIANMPEGKVRHFAAANADTAQAAAAEAGKVSRVIDGGHVQVANTQAELDALPIAPTEADNAALLNYAQTKEEAAADPAGTRAVVVRDAENNVIESQAVGASVADQVVAGYQEQYPNAQVEITTPEAVIEERRQGVAAEKAARAATPRTLGAATAGVDLTPASPAAVEEAVEETAPAEPLTLKAVQALSDDELRARLEQAELEVVERPTPTGEKTYSPKARTDAAAAVVSRVEKAWGITSNVAVLAGLLGRGEVGKRVQQSEALDMLAEARTPAGRAKIEQALQDDAALADVIDRLSLRGPSYAQQDVVESRIDRLVATRALLARQDSVRAIVSESKPAAPVTPVNTTASAKAVGGALAATEEAVAIGAAERRARATRAGLDAPVTEQSQAEGETSVRTVVKDTKTKEDASQDAWESAVLGATTAEEIDAAARDIGAQAGVGALKARLAAQRQKVNLADVEVAEKYAGDRVAYLMAERGMSEDAAYVALGKSKPKASKVTQSETVQGPAPKKEKDATVPFQQGPSVSAAQTIDESGTTSKGATDGLAAYTGRMREVLGGLTDAGTRLFAALYTPPRMSAERRMDLASDFRDMLESEGLLDRQGKGVQGLAAALIVAARDTASGHTGDVEVADHYEKTEGDEYTKEAIVSHNPQRHLDDIVEMERVAQRLLRGETDARTHQKLVRTALRMLFPATDFGLRRQTNMEIEKDGRDPSEATYAVDNTAAASRMLGAEDANQHAEELFQDLLLERLAEELMGGADSVGDITPSLNAVSTRGAVALRGDKARHAAALGAINQPLVNAYRAAIALDMVLHAKEDPEFGLTMPQLRELLRDPGTRDMALGALRARLQGMPSAAQMQEAIDATLATQGPGTNESNAANAKGVARGAAHRGDEELSNSVFGYFMNRAVAWIEAVTGLGQRYKRAGAEPRVFDTHTVVALDSETYYEEGGYSLRNIRPGAYVDDPRFRVHFWTVRRPGDAEATVLRTPGEVKDYLAKLRAEAAQSGKPLLLAAHNAAFDARVLNKAYGIELQEGERWVDTVSLFRAAVPQSGVTKESPRPSHRLELLAARLREAGVTGIDEKDSAANTAASGKRMPWHEGGMEAVTDDELAAFEDYAKNDTSVVLAALDHFDPSPAFVDLSNAETAIRRGLPGSATGLMAAMGQHGVVPAVGFGKMNDSSRRMTTAASANNLMPVTLVEGNVPRDVFVDMAALAHYSQSGEHRPGNVLEAYQNLTANLSRMMAADPDTTAGDRMRAVPHIEPMILPDSLVIHFAEGKPLTVADARRAEAQQIRDGATRAETPRVRAQEQMKVAVIDQSIEVLVDERMALEAETAASSPANEEALELISRRASGELKGSEAARLASLAGDKVKAAYYAILRAKMEVATGMPSMLRAVGIDIPADAAVDLDMLFSLRGDSLATLRDIKVRDTVARDMATVSDVQDDKTEDVLLAEARAKEGYDEVDMSMRRRARIDADRAWMEEGAESPQARGNDYGTPQLESRRMEDDIQLEGEQATRERMANPARLPGYVPPQHSAAPKVAPEPVSTIGAPTRHTKGDSDFRNLAGREIAAIERMVSTLDGFAAKQVQAVRDLLSRVAERGVPVLGATLIPLHQGGMVEGAPERVLNRMGITPTPELVAALREGRSFYVLTRSGPVIGVANFGASPNGRARMLNDLAHELGHMVRDRVWKSMDAPTREAISLDFAADHPEQLTKEQRAAAEHEWFANRMAGAVLSTLKTATEGVSHPVARLMGKMYSAARQLWAGLNAALGRSQAFDKFALELFAGTYRDAGTTTRLATDGAMEIYNADGYERVRKQATGKLQMAKGGAVSAWKKGVLPAIRSALANVATRIEHFDPLLSRQLFQGANANSTGKRAFEQDYRAIRSRLRGAIEKAMLTFESEDAFRQAFDDLIQGRDTAGAKTVGTLIEGLQTSAREAGLRSVLFRAKEPPMVFDRERVEHNRVEFEHMLLRAGLTPLQVRETVTGIVEGEHAIEMSIAPGVSVGDHGSNHLLGQRLDRAKLQAEGWLLDRHAEALMHWADAVAKRAAWDTAFGEYMTAGGAEAAARTYFGTHRVTASQVAQLREAGMIDDAGRLFHTNHKFVRRLDLIERVHGSAARQEVMDLTLGALGKHPAGQRMPKWVRNSQDFVLGWIGKTMLVYSGLMSLPEPALAFARAGGTVGLGDSFRSFGEARRFARDMGIVLSDSAEYMAFQGEQYQSTAMRKFDHWFFKLNGNQAVTNFSRVMATNIAIRYLHSAVETGDVAALERLNVTAEQVEIWEAKGRPAWATHLDPSTRGIAAAVGDAINQFVQEASLQPSRFQATHWGNNPYMRALWQLKHFLFTTGSTLVAGTYREMARRFKDGDMIAAAVPLILFGVVAMPLAMAAGEARDWLRRLNGQQSEFEDPVLDRVIGGVRRTGIFGPAEIGLGIWKQVEWGNGPLAALSPAFSVTQRVYGKVLPGETMDGTPKDADYEEALRLLIPLVSQNKGLWEMLAK